MESSKTQEIERMHKKFLPYFKVDKALDIPDEVQKRQFSCGVSNLKVLETRGKNL